MRDRDKILLAHGSGGRMSHELVEKLFLPPFVNPALARLDDSAVLEMSKVQSPKSEVRGPSTLNFGPLTSDFRLAFTTDSHVVKPLFFPGGDIGRLAVCGTVNDLAMSGATPLYLSAAFVIEEGLTVGILRRVVESMRAAAAEVGIQIVAGDTKVVEQGGADGLFISTAGVGLVPPGVDISGTRAQVGDVVLLSGPIGDHGIAVLSEREGLGFETELESDIAPLNGLVAAMLEASHNIHVLRDPTRGGLATTLNEIARQSQVGIRIEEGKIPVRPAVHAACEMLGYDPLYVANEGKLVAMVAPEDAEAVLAAMRKTRHGQGAVAIGQVVAEPAGRVLMQTEIGGTRLVDMLTGEMLPRIC
ncbi:MAG: hydrogenase expression/formation protein HypE [Anaerolineae bacterium]